jgi:hypothetical protein
LRRNGLAENTEEYNRRNSHAEFASLAEQAAEYRHRNGLTQTMTYESALDAENEFQKNENISLAQAIIEDQ